MGISLFLIITYPQTIFHRQKTWYTEKDDALNSLSQNLTVLPAPSRREPLAWRESLRLNRRACGRACSPGGAVAQRLKGFKSAEPEKTVKRSSRRTGVNLQFFPVQPTSLGLKGASNPFFVAPARRNRCDLAVLNTQHLLRKPVCDLKAPLGLSCLAGTAALFFSFGVKREHPPVRHFPPIVDRSIYRRYPRHAAHRKIL